jgi:MFS family permease
MITFNFLTPRKHMNQSTHPSKLQIFQYSLAILLFWVSMYLYVPTLPVFAQGKTNNLAITGIVLSMYGLFQGLARFPLGVFSDRLGKRRIFVMIGFGLSALGALLMSTAPNAGVLLVGRAVTGLAAATWVPLVVAFTGLFPRGDALRASAVVNVLNSIGMVVGTLLTGWLNGLGGYPLAFYIAIGVAGFAALVMMPIAEKAMEPQKRSMDEIKNLVARRSVLVPSLLGALAQYAVWATVFSFIPLLAKQYGASDVLQSMLLSLNLAIVLAGNLVVTAFVKRFGARPLLYFSFILIALGMLLAALANSLLLVFAAQFCNGFALGIGFPILMGLSVEHANEKERSTAMGLFQAVYAIGMFTGPWLSGFLANSTGIQPMFAITAVAVLVVALFGMHFLVTHPKTGEVIESVPN